MTWGRGRAEQQSARAAPRAALFFCRCACAPLRSAALHRAAPIAAAAASHSNPPPKKSHPTTNEQLLDPPKTDYVDRRFKGTREEYFRKLNASSTLYVGNMSFYTTEDQVYALFSKAGRVRRVIMGLDSQRRTPCGFCFVVYDAREDALAAVKYLNGTSLDERPIRVDVDYGFEEGRQFGRGRSGGQVRDEFRTDYDSARGGFGKQLVQQIQAQGLAVRETEAGQVTFVPVAARGGGGGGGAGNGGGGGAGGGAGGGEQRGEGGQREEEGEEGQGGPSGRAKEEEEEDGGNGGGDGDGGAAAAAAVDDDEQDDDGDRRKRRRLGSDDDDDMRDR